MQFPSRKHPRLKQFDYRSAGAYFVTICTWNHKCLFGSIEPTADPETILHSLSRFGEIAQRQILNLEHSFPFLELNHFVVMPNHIHLLVTMDESAMQQTNNLFHIIGRLKSLTTRECWQQGYIEKQLFQTSYYEHVIRNQAEFDQIWNYIDQNPKKWTLDRYYII